MSLQDITRLDLSRSGKPPAARGRDGAGGQAMVTRLVGGKKAPQDTVSFGLFLASAAGNLTMHINPPADESRLDWEFLIHPLHRRAAQEQAQIWVRGRGATLFNSVGGEFLDALAGLWNVVVGHGREELAEAAARQMRELAYASAYAGATNRPAIQLAERLATLCYPSIRRFFFTCGGAEANETAIKTARYYWKLRGQPDKHRIISRAWAYHGTTLATMSATGMPSYWPMFEPRVPGFSHIESPYPYRFSPVKKGVGGDRGAPARSVSEGPDRPHIPARPVSEGPAVDGGDHRTPGQIAADRLEDEILALGAGTVAAFIGEPVQGAGGVIVPPDDYWPRIREICDRHQVLLIADEVITGFGRSGDWFALSRYGVEPDILTFAKGITSGYIPLGGMGVNASIAEAIDSAPEDRAWMHAFTYSGHPVACAVALANLEILEREGLLARSAEIGQRLRGSLASLSSHRHVGEVRGLGSLAAVELVADKGAKTEFPPGEKVGPRVHAATLERGMVTRLRGDVYNFAPCYVTTFAEIDRMANILGDSIDAVLG